MLFAKETWPGLADGSITVAVRRWKRPTVKAGGTLRSPAGLLAIESVDPIEEGDLTPLDAVEAGHESVEALLEALPPAEPGRTLYRITFRPAGPDPRDDLRERDDLDEVEIAEVLDRLAAMDARAGRPWTEVVLGLIDTDPGVPARELAPRAGYERDPFKRQVTKLKGLGLTISLSPGYRLSPRGEAVLTALRRREDRGPETTKP